MSNYGSKILSNAVSALTAQQAMIANTGKNISNVNTEGYAKRVTALQTRLSTGGGGGTIQVGNGVEVANINRITDEFLQSLVRTTSSSKYSFQAQNDILERVQPLFNLTGDRATIGSALSEFFNSFSTLAINPSSLELRQDVLERGQDLVEAIQATYQGLANLQTEADLRLTTEITTINSLTEQIAELNGLVSAREAGGYTAADERDRRDTLLEQLSQRIGVNILETSDGSVNISLSNGFMLVSGITSRALELTDNPDFVPGLLPPSLGGGVLRYVVYDYAPDTPGSGQLDLTQELLRGGGTVGGLLTVRGYADPSNTSPFEATGPLTELAARVEAITQALLTQFNSMYLGPDRGPTPGYHDPSSVDLNGGTPSVFGFFTFEGLAGVDVDGLPTNADLAAFGFANYSSRLRLTLSDPAAIAASLDISGGPPAPIAGAQGDNRNIVGDQALGHVGLSSLQTTLTATLGVTGTAITYSGNMSDLYNQLVGRAGNLKARTEIAFSVAEDNLVTAQNRRDEISGVSLDEEFSALVQFQRAFEANARMIRIADQLLEQIVALI